MPATAADYTWVRDVSNGMFLNAYCATLVLGLTDDDLFERLGVDEYVATSGVSEAANLSLEWLVHYGCERFVAVTPVEEGALMIEPSGTLGVRQAVALPLSEGGELVSHFRDVNAYGRFWWVRDGDVRVDFDPMFPNDSRTGSAPDDLVDEMAAVGFDVAPSDAGTAEASSGFTRPPEPWVGPVAGSFALAERVTAIAVSRDLLDEATFFCGEARTLG